MEGETTDISFDISLAELSGDKFNDFDFLGDKLLDIVSKNLGFSVPSILMFDEHANGLRITKYRSPLSIDKVVELAIGRTISDLVFPISCKRNIFVDAFVTKNIRVTSTVRDMVVPFFENKFVAIFDRLLDVKMMAVVPIVVDAKSVGVLVFGSKTKHEISIVEIKFLDVLSKQLGHYLKHAWILHSLTKKNEIIVNENARLNQLLALNKNAIRDVSELLTGLLEPLEIPDVQKNIIQSHIEYLQSIYLISENK